MSSRQLNLKTGRMVDIDGHVDDRGICYYGYAVEYIDGSWVCLANIDGTLCRVEVKINVQT